MRRLQVCKDVGYENSIFANMVKAQLELKSRRRTRVAAGKTHFVVRAINVENRKRIAGGLCGELKERRMFAFSGYPFVF